MTILVAIDFEPCSRAALAVARELATARRARLIILHVLTGTSVGGAAGLAMQATARGLTPDEFALSDAATRMQEFLRDGGPPAPDERTRIEVGTPSERIATIANEERASTVVVGTHGRGRIGSAVLGSVARDVMNRISYPVIAVHGPEPAPHH